MSPKEKSKTDISSDSEQKDIGRDAINKTNCSQDSHITINNLTINNFTIKEKPTIEEFAKLIAKTNKNVYAEVQDDSKSEKQAKDWSEKDGFFSLIEGFEDAEQKEKILTFGARHKKLIKKLRPIIDLLPDKDKTFLINSIKIVSKEDEINELKNGESINEAMEELGSLKAITEPYKLEPKIHYKRVYNLLRCGEIENEFLEELEKIKTKTNNDEEARKSFICFWGQMLKDHPNKVFLSSEIEAIIAINIAKNKILNKLKKTKKVYLYTKGKSLNLSGHKIKKLLEKEVKNIHINPKEYKIAKLPAIKFTISIT